MNNENVKINQELLSLERALNQLHEMVENEYLFSSNNEALRYYSAKKLIESMIDIKSVLGDLI